MSEMPKTLVVQYGGRRQYAIPALLAESNHLEALYTDLTIGVGAGNLLALIPEMVRKSLGVEFSYRRLPVSLHPYTKTFFGWHLGIAGALKNTDPSALAALLEKAHDRASRKMITSGFGEAEQVLTMFGEGVLFRNAASSKGLASVIDVNIAPSSEDIVAREAAIHHGWGDNRRVFRDVGRLCEGADTYLCPSEFVRQDLVKNYGIEPEKVVILPYAVNDRWFTVENKPVPRRILFCGTADLRKGIHVLAAAAEKLVNRGNPSDFVVAGSVSDDILARRDVGHLQFLGRVSGQQLAAEYSKADILVLPSIAEGSAGVTYEALGCGIPVVTTFESGSIVRDGLDGYIVPARNPDALADRIEDIVEDRERRVCMSQSARSRAREFDWQAFKARLISALSSRGKHEVSS
jgi:hypothetical protein